MTTTTLSHPAIYVSKLSNDEIFVVNLFTMTCECRLINDSR